MLIIIKIRLKISGESLSFIDLLFEQYVKSECIEFIICAVVYKVVLDHHNDWHT